MSEPADDRDKEIKGNDAKESPENLLRMIDDLLAHTNRSRRVFLIFIASALIFAPVALVMGGILIGHPRYSVFNLERSHEEFARNMTFGNYASPDMQLFLVQKNGSTIVREVQLHPPIHPIRQDIPIFIGIQAFIFICIIFSAVLLYVALKEYRFFAKWNTRYKRYKETQDKIEDELGKD